MATPVGPADPSVETHLNQEPWDFSFFQAVRLLGLMTQQDRLLARFGEPPGEGVRFHAHPSIAFPTSAIQALLKDAKNDGLLHMTVNFMGLTGPTGVLPAFYTEYLLERRAARDETAIDFFDIFNHRLVSLFYFAWEKYHFPIAHERQPDVLQASRGFSQYLFDLIGMGTPGLRGNLELEDTALVYYAGLIGQRPRSAVALEGILRDFFKVPVNIEQFVGKWYRLETENLSYLDSQGDYGLLGEGAIAGDQVWNQQAAFAVEVGPLDWEKFNLFLPGGSTYKKMVSLVRYFVNQASDFEIRLILRSEEVPFCALEDSDGSPRLGFSSWLKTSEFENDARDTVVAVNAWEGGGADTRVD